MFRRLLAGSTLIAASAWRPVNGSVGSPSPRSRADGHRVGSARPSAGPGPRRERPSPQAPASAPQTAPQPTPPPSFSQGSEQKRGEVPVAPGPPGSTGGGPEIRPTTEPAPVKAQGPATTAKDELIYVRGARLWIASADGKDHHRCWTTRLPNSGRRPATQSRLGISLGRQVAFTLVQRRPSMSAKPKARTIAWCWTVPSPRPVP